MGILFSSSQKFQPISWEAGRKSRNSVPFLLNTPTLYPESIVLGKQPGYILFGMAGALLVFSFSSSPPILKNLG